MSGGGHSHQATRGSNSSAQGRSDYPYVGHDSVGHDQSSDQNNRLTLRNLQRQDSQGAQGTFGQGGAQYQGYQQGQGQAQVPFYTRDGPSDQPQYNGHEVNRYPDPRRGEPYQTPYFQNQSQEQYGAAQQQPQNQYSEMMRRFAQSDQSYDPYGTDSQRRDR